MKARLSQRLHSPAVILIVTAAIVFALAFSSNMSLIQIYDFVMTGVEKVLPHPYSLLVIFPALVLLGAVAALISVSLLRSAEEITGLSLRDDSSTKTERDNNID